MQDVLSALINLGYPQAMARQAVRKVQKMHPGNHRTT
jgi:Holliday junction resolvasome RuvABC DNA-binding subunit